MDTFLVRNQTPDRLIVDGTRTRLVLAPLQRLRVGGDPGLVLGASAFAARRDHALDWEREPVRSARLVAAAWLVGAGIMSAAIGLVDLWFTERLRVLQIGLGVGFLCAFVGAVVVASGGHLAASTPSDEFSDPAKTHGGVGQITRDFAVAAMQGLALVLMVGLAFGVPAGAIYYGTELSDVVRLHSWHDAELIQGPGAQDIVVARLLQLVLLILVSLVPALMFFQFNREKLTTLVDRWLHAIFRLDPSVQTVADVDAKYGRRVEEFYGTSLTGEAPRKRFRDLSPVIIATALIAIGWIVVLLNTDGNGRGLPTMQELFRPIPTPMTMAFLGAYFLSIQVALRGYVRGDLKPKTYNVITVRVLIAVILAWAMQALWGSNNLVLALSFLAGIIPNTVLIRIRAWAMPKVESDKSELSTRSPLTVIDEIDVYERTRLEEEGITNVQALARHDFIDLILSSRIPVPRLIDWLDQALLYQHVPESITALRRVGIRTATDFLRVASDADALAELNALTCNPCKECNVAMNVPTTLLCKVLEKEEWLAYVSNWRENDGTEPARVRTYRSNGRVIVKLVSPPTRPGPHPSETSSTAGTIPGQATGSPNGNVDVRPHERRRQSKVPGANRGTSDPLHVATLEPTTDRSSPRS
jgi:hypothetical protein